MSGAIVVVPDGWRLSWMDNLPKNETVMRLLHVKMQQWFEYAVPMHRLDNTDDALYDEIQQWVWRVTGEKPPTPNPAWPKAEWTAMEKIIAERHGMTPTKSKPKVEPPLPPGITRHIELE